MLVNHADVAATYKNYEAAAFLRQDNRDGFMFGGSPSLPLTIMEYPVVDRVGDTPFFPADEGRIIPLGIPDLFAQAFAPADYMEAVGTLGQKFYAKSEEMSMGKGVMLEVQSNTLVYCTRPEALIKVAIEAES